MRADYPVDKRMSHKSRYEKAQKRQGKPTIATQVKLDLAKENGIALSEGGESKNQTYIVAPLEKMENRLRNTTLKNAGVDPLGPSPGDGLTFLRWSDVLRDCKSADEAVKHAHSILRYVLAGAPLTWEKAKSNVPTYDEKSFGDYMNAHLGDPPITESGKVATQRSLRMCWTEAHNAFARLVNPRKGPRTDAMYGLNGEEPFKILHQILQDYPLLALAEKKQKRGPCDYDGWKVLREQVLGQNSHAEITMKPSSLRKACEYHLSYIIQLNGGKKLEPISIEESMVKILDNGCGENGLGYPFHIQGRHVGDPGVWDVIKFWAKKAVRCELHPYQPLQVGMRVQSGRADDNGVYKSKPRAVLADPKFVQVAMGCYTYPKQDLHQAKDIGRVALMSPKVIQETEALIAPLREGKFGYSLDWDRFDRNSMAVLHFWYTNYAWRLFSNEPKEFFEWAAINHKYAPINLEDGFLWFHKGHGLCSGKIDTNDAGSDVNRISVYAALIDITEDHLNRELTDDEVSELISCFFITAQGDDNVTICTDYEKLRALIQGDEECWRLFSLEVLRHKLSQLGGQELSTDPDKVLPFGPDSSDKAISFLSKYTAILNGEEFNHQHSFTRALNSIINPETLCTQEIWLSEAKVKNENVVEGHPDFGKRVPIRVGWLNNPDITGPILLKWWGSLSNVAYNKREFMIPVLDWIVSSCDHHFNPMLLKRPDKAAALLMRYGSHIDLNEISDGIDNSQFFVDTANAHNKVANSIEFIKTYDYSVMKVLELADYKPEAARSTEENEEIAAADFHDDLMAAFGNGRLYQSIVNALPET